MRFWKLSYYADDTPDGLKREFFPNWEGARRRQREVEEEFAELRREADAYYRENDCPPPDGAPLAPESDLELVRLPRLRSDMIARLNANNGQI